MTNVAFLVNGDGRSAMAERANAFASRLKDRHNIRVAYRSSRKIASMLRFFAFLVKAQPAVIYVFDMSYSGVLAGLLYKLTFGARVIIDTGDAIYELARSMGRGKVGRTLTRLLETISLRAADRIVVRGTFHQRILEEQGVRAELIHDGVETSQFRPMDVAALRRECGLEGFVTLGVVGSVVWNDALGMCYGSEIAEVIALLKGAPVKGVIIGDGPGLSRLEDYCRALGIEDRILFMGRIAYDELPRYLSLIDVCISTQTDDVVGQVRTTSKLPQYMAAGRYVLATRVGEAALCLPDEMLVEYEGKSDPSYARRLSERIEGLIADRGALAGGLENVEVARTKFDYSVLADRLDVLLKGIVGITTQKTEECLITKPDLR